MYRLKDLEKEMGRHGYGVDVGLTSLFLQFFDDVSDREREERLRYDLGFKWFRWIHGIRTNTRSFLFWTISRTSGNKTNWKGI